MPRLFYCLISVLLVQQGFAKETTQCSSNPLSTPLCRPQEPCQPYPYLEEEIFFENSAAEIKLAGTLTLPQSKGPFPAVVLLHGSAPFDRDCSFHGHKPFLVWADHLTRQGIAVLRFDKRSAGKSTGDYTISTVHDFASDALAAVEYLKTRQEINIRQIGLIGHSEGGVTASIAAAESSEAVLKPWSIAFCAFSFWLSFDPLV